MKKIQIRKFKSRLKERKRLDIGGKEIDIST